MNKKLETRQLSVRFWGQNALFTRPELKVERFSYPFPTFSAVVGMLESIYWFPGLRIRVRRIHVLRKGRYASVMRNEIQDKQSHKAKNGYLLIEDSRTQRRSTILQGASDRDKPDEKDYQDYVVDFEISLGDAKRLDKVCDRFARRIELGQCFQQPYFGCREFPAWFEPAPENFEVDPELRGKTEFLGNVLHQVDYSTSQPRPVYKEMFIVDGAIDEDLTHPQNSTATGYDSLLKVLWDLRREDMNSSEPEMPPFGYLSQPFTYRIEIDADGRIIGGMPVKLGKDKQKSEYIDSPYILKFKANNTLPPRLLNEGAKIVYCQPEYLDMLQLAYNETGHLGVQAVIKHVKASNGIPEGLKPEDSVAFQLGSSGEYITDAQELKQFWRRYLEDLTKDYPIGTCAITGKKTKISMKYPVRVKGVPGANAYGASLFSADKPAFEWHGRKSNDVCRISEEVARGCIEALNDLLSSHDSCLKDSSGIAITFWGSKQNISFANLVATDYNQEATKDLLERLWRGGNSKEDPNQIHMLVLAGAAGRVSVLDWIQYRESLVLENVKRWLDNQQVRHPKSVFALTGCCTPPGKANAKARSKTLLLFVRNALFGDKLPHSLLVNVIQRIEAERTIRVSRSAVLGLFLYQFTRKTMQEIEQSTNDSKLDERRQFYLRLGKFYGYCAAIETLVKTTQSSKKCWGDADAARSLNASMLRVNLPRIMEKVSHWYNEGLHLHSLTEEKKGKLHYLIAEQGKLDIDRYIEQGFDLNIKPYSEEHTLFLVGFRATCWKGGENKKNNGESN